MVYKSIEPFLLGGISSCNAELFTFPIDLVKTRLQIQGQAINNCSGKYRGMFHCFVTIYKEEGFKTLFSGIKPALLRQATYGTLKLGFYQYLKKLLFSKDVSNHQEHFYKNIFIGSLSGATANALANPTDVLKIRMQANQKNFKSKSMISAFIDMYKHEGLSGLYRGVLPNAQRAAVITGVELSIYDSAKQFLIYRFSFDDNIFTHFMGSGIAGLCAAIAATPIDVIKTRVMDQRNLKDNSNNSVIYRGSIDCLLKTVKSEGPLALYRGFIPSYLRLAPWNIIFFLTYEQFKTH
ncbi:unnamed protein product [Brachionus calyciflorus]|uniref:Uncharacterized protein n=1 Tax=Brachionus calyciflorus TaxID=104777 RepID=A0A813UB20_9BILA|nr:unnamed protein product [Brachionus calyciflorus]